MLLTYHPLLRDRVVLLQASAQAKKDAAYNAVRGSERKSLEMLVCEGGLFAEEQGGAASAFYADWEEEEAKEHGESGCMSHIRLVLALMSCAPRRRARAQGQG